MCYLWSKVEKIEDLNYITVGKGVKGLFNVERYKCSLFIVFFAFCNLVQDIYHNLLTMPSFRVRFLTNRCKFINVFSNTCCN